MQKPHFHSADFPNAFDNQSQILSIPLYAEINVAQIKRLVSLINSFDKQLTGPHNIFTVLGPERG